MSVVVRIDVPRSCDKCDLCKRCEAFRYYILQIAEAVPVRPKPYPLCDGCLFVRQLPEGHGRLVDAEILRAKLIEHIAETNGFYNAFNKTPTIVPAERGETCLD